MTEPPSPPARLPGPLGDIGEKVLSCVHCGFCLPACPTYTLLGDEADSPRGRLYLMRAAVEGQLPMTSVALHLHIDRCLGCRACESVCPASVEYGALLNDMRAVLADNGSGSSLSRALVAVFGNRHLAAVVFWFGRVLRGSGLARLLVALLPRQLSRLRLALAMLAGSAGWRGLREAPIARLGAGVAGFPTAAPAGPKVALLTGCVQAGLFARVNDATARVLSVNGFRVIEARRQECCGALHAHAGDLEGARLRARANIEAFERSGADLVVANAAGCGAALKEYGQLLANDPEWAARAVAMAARARDVFELLAERGAVRGAPLRLLAAYDAPCHLEHAQKVTIAPLAVLRAVTGIEVTPLSNSSECCGGAGLYGLLEPALSGRMLDKKLGAIDQAGTRLVLTPNPGCIMQIASGLLLRGLDGQVVHPIELVDESYRRAGAYEAV